MEKLRFLKRSNLLPEQDLQRGYYREIIHHYGIDVIYFRKDNSFFNSPSGLCNYTYGEDTTSTYFLSAPMVVFKQMSDDAFILSKFGIETQGKANIYFMIDDFTNQFRDLIGTATSAIFDNIYISGNLNSFSGKISGSFNQNSLKAFTYMDLSASNSGYISGIYNSNAIDSLKEVNTRTKLKMYFDDGGKPFILGNLSGIWDGNIDVSGNGYVSGIVSGLLGYWIPPAENTGPKWEIAPQVGDYFKLADVFPDNQEEYEITQIFDRNLQDSGTNPLLDKYIWQCSIVRRDPSYEKVIVSDDVEEQHTIDKTEKDMSEEVSNSIFDYTLQPIDNDLNVDNIYGGYTK